MYEANAVLKMANDELLNLTQKDHLKKLKMLSKNARKSCQKRTQDQNVFTNSAILLAGESVEKNNKSVEQLNISDHEFPHDQIHSSSQCNKRYKKNFIKVNINNLNRVCKINRRRFHQNLNEHVIVKRKPPAKKIPKSKTNEEEATFLGSRTHYNNFNQTALNLLKKRVARTASAKNRVSRNPKKNALSINPYLSAEDRGPLFMSEILPETSIMNTTQTSLKRSNNKKKKNINDKNIIVLEGMKDTIQKFKQGNQNSKKRDNLPKFLGPEIYGLNLTTVSDPKNQTFYTNSTAEQSRIRPISAKAANMKIGNLKEFTMKIRRAHARSIEKS
ncbi:unnamed protein product [Moneuplotes crassus]|uniref:Uncharacterized protein n=1 Tax=Euplotes crassus TaxID=5936 RepID=A0AAD1UKF1_EUPCR|nr:unnamed protein product [Moneuplotes crassus]